MLLLLIARLVEFVNCTKKKLIFFLNLSPSLSTQYSVIYYEPDGDRKYPFITKPKLVTVPDSEILQVSFLLLL